MPVFTADSSCGIMIGIRLGPCTSARVYRPEVLDNGILTIIGSD